MSNIPDIRDNPSYGEAVQLLQMQWPSDPFPPSAPRAHVSGIDCLAILYRTIHASLSRTHWPRDEPEGAAYQAILRYFWADFGHMEHNDGPVRDQLRQAALAQIQATMQVASADFAALCESPAMMDLVWAREAFCFYGTPWWRLKKGDTWVERTDLHTHPYLASVGRLDWNPRTHPVLQDLVDQMSNIEVETAIGAKHGSKAEVKYSINEPLIIRVIVRVDEGVRVSLSDAQRFTAATMRPADNAPPAAGPNGVSRYDTPQTHGYVLAAAVQVRSCNPGADHDTIRVFDTEGRETVPTNTHREQWRGSVRDMLPEGRFFLFLYERVEDFGTHRLRHARRGPAPPSLYGLVQRKIDEDEYWCQQISDTEQQPSYLAQGPAQGEGSRAMPQCDAWPQDQLAPAGTPTSGPQQPVAQQTAAAQAPKQDAAVSQSKHRKRKRDRKAGGEAQQQGHAQPAQSPPPPVPSKSRRGGPSAPRGRSGHGPSVPRHLSDANSTKQGTQRSSRGHR